jgi:putative ABC transport system substrate-binding protein
MKRREFITLLGGAAAWPLAGLAEQARSTYRIGALISISESDSQTSARIAAFREGLQNLGWVDGSNVRIDFRFGAGNPNHIRDQAVELAATKPDVIFASGTPTVSALQRSTSTIPIVFAMVNDPVGSGFVASLTHPDGNITGFINFEYTIAGKWLGVLKEIAPRIARAVAILDRQNISSTGHFGALQMAGSSAGIAVDAIGVRDAVDIEKAISTVATQPNGGLVFLPSGVVTTNRDHIIEQVARQRIPAVYPYAYYPKSGGLVSYGTDPIDLYRRATSYIDRILRGAKPGDLPIQAPTKFELVINLKTARALGLTVPPSMLALADEVIE